MDAARHRLAEGRNEARPIHDEDVFNANTITGENFAYDVWRQPQYILPARFFKVSAQFDF